MYCDVTSGACGWRLQPRRLVATCMWLGAGFVLCDVQEPGRSEFRQPKIDFRTDGVAPWGVLQERLSATEVQTRGTAQRTVDHCSQRSPRVEVLDNSSDLEAVHVVYAADRNIFDGLLGSMLSLARRLIPPRRCTCHIIVPKADLAAASRMRECFLLQIEHIRHSIDVELHEEQPLAFGIDERSGLHRNTLAYARLRVDVYFPTLPRVVWMDTDTILKADVSMLFRLRMRSTIAAAREIGRYRFPRHVPERPVMPGLHPLETMFNSGVLLIDLRRWREQGISKKLAVVAIQNPWAQDQEILNIAFVGKWDVLSWKWNLLSMCLGFRWPQYCLDGARLLHFTGEGKPWNVAGPENRCIPHADLYEPSFRCDYDRESWMASSSRPPP